MSDRVYTASEICATLKISRRSFGRLTKAGKPWLRAVRITGRTIRYRADLVDRFASGQWDEPRSFSAARLLKRA